MAESPSPFPTNRRLRTRSPLYSPSHPSLYQQPISVSATTVAPHHNNSHKCPNSALPSHDGQKSDGLQRAAKQHSTTTTQDDHGQRDLESG